MRITFLNVTTPRSSGFFYLKMEAVRSSEMSAIFYRTAYRHIRDDDSLHSSSVKTSYLACQQWFAHPSYCFVAWFNWRHSMKHGVEL
jgi:hypothetical protein